MAALIGALRVSLSADTAQFDAGMRRAQATAASASSGIQKALGALKAGVAGLVSGLSIGLFANVIKGALDYAGSLGEMAQQMGVTSRELQVFRFAAGQAGISTDQMDNALAKLSVSMSKALSGSKTAIAAFKSVGVELSDLQTKSRTEIFGMIADQMVKQGGAAKNAAAGMAIFGRGVMSLAPLLDQGSAGIDQLAQAADKLGIVLSDEQIQKADETADKLDAMKTVLSANIAGVVADNSDAILGLANALMTIVSAAAQAAGAFASFIGVLRSQAGLGQIARGMFEAIANPGLGGQTIAAGIASLGGGSSVTVKLPPAKPFKRGPTGSPPQFLAGGGGSKKKRGGGAKADHSAENKLRDEYQFAEQQRRAEMDILRAKQDLATDYQERAHFSIQMLDLEHEGHEAEMQYQVALNKLTGGKQGLTEAQADQLRLAYDIKDGLERQKVAVDTQAEQEKRLQDMREHDFDRQRDILESQAAIADTAEERRRVELEILRLAYEQKRQALQHILDTSRDADEMENARRDLAGLNATYGNDRQGVLNATRGPLEEWAASLPHTTAQINEAFEGIQVDAFEGLATAIQGVVSGTTSLKDAFTNLAQSVVAQILQMTIRMLIFKAISGGINGLFGGGGGATGLAGGMDFSGTFGAVANVPKFATGGGFNILGRTGRDRNMLSLNGLPIARVSHGERINISNDNVNEGQAKVLIVPTPYFDAHVQGQAAAVAAPMAARSAIAGASGAMNGIYRRRARTLP